MQMSRSASAGIRLLDRHSYNRPLISITRSRIASIVSLGVRPSCSRVLTPAST